MKLCPYPSTIFFALSCFLNTASTNAAESAFWQQFKQAIIEETEPTLPDFSYAGYDYSESQTPDTSSWAVFYVTAYGAIADDTGFDDTAIQAAIDAAEAAGGGVVFFPPGQYKISPNETVGENIFINGSNILLKGSGSGAGGTEIFKVNKKVDNGSYIFEVEPTSLSESTKTTVVADAPRESFEIEVASTASLSVGQRIILRTDSIPYALAYFAPQSLQSAWTRIESETGFAMREIHTIAAISGTTVTLREPLHLPMITSYNSEAITIQVRTYPVITDVGIEDILFKGNWDSYPENFVHHKDDIHDYAWNAIRFDNVANGWIRNCEFKDWNQCIYFDGCQAFTVENVHLTGKKGHTSIHTRRSYGVLVKDCRDTAGHHHGCGVGYWNTGTVYLRYDMNGSQRMDSHSGSPYATLFDNVTGGHFDGNGGPHVSYPHHAKYFVAWNVNVSGGPSSYNFWQASRNGHTFAMPFFIGLQGKNISITGGTFAANESPGSAVEPASLFEAQLALRLSPDKDEDDLTDAWEKLYFNNLTSTDGRPDQDSDGDGSSDRFEHDAGTLPNDETSFFTWSITGITETPPSKEIDLEWSSVNGKIYNILGSSTLDDPWGELATDIPAAGSTTTHKITTSEPIIFLQMKIEEPD